MVKEGKASNGDLCLRASSLPAKVSGVPSFDTVRTPVRHSFSPNYGGIALHLTAPRQAHENVFGESFNGARYGR